MSTPSEARVRRPTNVSLISSWFDAELGRNPPTHRLPPSLEVPLREGFNFLDLYVFSHSEIVWFASLCEPPIAAPEEDPTAFLAGLETKDVITIAGKLLGLLHNHRAEPKQGIVTWRPLIVALATFFPTLSHTEINGHEPLADRPGSRQLTAIKALRRALRLAYELGARVVEVVGGAGVPQMDSPYAGTPDHYRTQHYASLSRAIRMAYDTGLEEDPEILSGIPLASLPTLAMELEPGASFLMNSLPAFHGLRKEYIQQVNARHPKGSSQRKALARKLTLNLDLAHAFILGYKPGDLARTPVGHVHASDHAAHFGRGGNHASDLVPGKFHLDKDYEPWIDFIVNDLSTRADRLFSGYISIELEACNALDRLQSALTTLRRWILEVPEPGGSPPPPAHPGGGSLTIRDVEKVEGFILTVDLGDSSGAALAFGGISGVSLLAGEVVRLMQEVYASGGCILGFGGDGFIALFETFKHTQEERQTLAARVCQQVAAPLALGWNPRAQGLGLRISLHLGEAWLISTGPLRGQAMSSDIVTSVRVCDLLKPIVEMAPQLNVKPTAFAITEEVHTLLQPTCGKDFVEDPLAKNVRDGSGRPRILFYHRKASPSYRSKSSD